jgi:hypothetical protein
MKPASGGEGNRTNNVPTAPTLGSKTNTVYTCFDVCDLWNGWVTRRDIYIATFARVGNYTSLLSILGVPPLSPEQKKEGTHHRSSFSSSIGTRISVNASCLPPASGKACHAAGPVEADLRRCRPKPHNPKTAATSFSNSTIGMRPRKMP